MEIGKSEDSMKKRMVAKVVSKINSLEVKIK